MRTDRRFFFVALFVLGLFLLGFTGGPITPQDDGYPNGTAPIGLGNPDQGWKTTFWGFANDGTAVYVNICSFFGTGGCQ
jgi:hypothetical protein